MRLEGRHAAERPLVVEGRHAPLDRFDDVRAALMDEGSQPLQDRPRELRRPRDVGVDPGGLFPHCGSSLRRCPPPLPAPLAPALPAPLAPAPDGPLAPPPPAA